MVAKRLNSEEKEGIKVFLLQRAKKLAMGSITHMQAGKGSIQEAATKWGVTASAIYIIWNHMKELDKAGKPMNLKPKYVGGRQAIPIDNQAVTDIELKHRKTIRAFAKSYGRSKSTCGRWKKRGDLRSATSAVKPALNEHHMLARLRFCINALTVDPITKAIIFKTMENIVHIDEKWFYLKQLVERYILLPHEVTPHRTAQSKAFIPKLMFMCAVSRPIWDANGELIWDGRLGIWPFVEEHEAQRRSVYRERGTLILKPVPSVNTEVTRDMVINQIIPCIKKYWPQGVSKVIKIQQDNAPCHISADDPEFVAAATSDGFNITMVNQPPRSPDTNINDLGFFCSIQSLQQEMQTEDIQELIDAVQMAFEVLKPETLDDVFLSSQQCMVEMMKVRGHNKYPQPHMGKQHLRAIGMLPRDLEVDTELVKDCIDYLLERNQQIDNVILMEALGYA